MKTGAMSLKMFKHFLKVQVKFYMYAALAFFLFLSPNQGWKTSKTILKSFLVKWKNTLVFFWQFCEVNSLSLLLFCKCKLFLTSFPLVFFSFCHNCCLKHVLLKIDLN